MRKIVSNEVYNYDSLLLGVYCFESVITERSEVVLLCESPVLALTYTIVDDLVEDAEI